MAAINFAAGPMMSPYIPNWNQYFGPITGRAEDRANQSANNLAQNNQQTGPIRGFFSDLLARQMPGSLSSNLAVALGLAANPLEGIQATANRRPTARTPSARPMRPNKWGGQNLQWGNPELGYYQPPDWSGWSNSPNLASNPFNPMGQNYGGQSINMRQPGNNLGGVRDLMNINLTSPYQGMQKRGMR